MQMLLTFRSIREKFKQRLARQRYVLALTDDEALLLQVGGDHSVPQIIASVPLQHPPEALLSSLKQGQSTPLEIVYLGSGQALKIEAVPKGLGHWDRFQWVTNRWKLFRKKSFFSSLCYHPFPQERLVFGSFPQHPLIDRWLEALTIGRQEINRVSLGVLAQAKFYDGVYQKVCHDPAAWLCVIAFEEQGGVRHTVLHQGCPLLTRILLGTVEQAFDLEEIEKEVQGTLRYIHKNISPSFETMDVLLLKQKDALNVRFDNLNNVRYTWVLSEEEIKELFEVPQANCSIFPLSLMRVNDSVKAPKLLKWWLNNHPKLFFHKRRFASCLVPIAAGLWFVAFYCFWDFMRVEDQLTLVQDALEGMTQQTQPTSMRADPMGLSGVSMYKLRQAVWAKQVLTRPRKDLTHVLAQLPHVLENNLKLNRFDWQFQDQTQSHTLTLSAYPPTRDQAHLETIFEHFLTRLHHRFLGSKLQIIHGPYGIEPGHLFTGELEEEEGGRESNCIVKLSWNQTQ